MLVIPGRWALNCPSPQYHHSIKQITAMAKTNNASGSNVDTGALTEEVAQLRAEIAALQSDLFTTLGLGTGLESACSAVEDVTVQITGVMMAAVAVELQRVDVFGGLTKNGRLNDAILMGPDISLDIKCVDVVGAGGTVKLTINNRTKSEDFVMDRSPFRKTFTFKFSDFGLPCN
jgi:hypothetical protein